MTRLLVSTGEVSGDLQGSLLIAALHRQAALRGLPLEVVALGGPRMEQAGARLLADTARLGAIGRTLATVRAARAAGLVVAACVLSHVAPPRGEFDDPAGDSGIARANAADLKRLLPAMPVTLLPHGASGFDPLLDWWALAGGLS